MDKEANGRLDGGFLGETWRFGGIAPPRSGSRRLRVADACAFRDDRMGAIPGMVPQPYQFASVPIGRLCTQTTTPQNTVLDTHYRHCPRIIRSHYGNPSSRYLLLGQRSKRKMTQPADVLIPPPNGVFFSETCPSKTDRERGTAIYFDQWGRGRMRSDALYPVLSSVNGTPTRRLHRAAQQSPSSCLAQWPA